MSELEKNNNDESQKESKPEENALAGCIVVAIIVVLFLGWYGYSWIFPDYTAECPKCKAEVNLEKLKVVKCSCGVGEISFDGWMSNEDMLKAQCNKCNRGFRVRCPSCGWRAP